MANIRGTIERALIATGSVAALARALNVAPSHVSRMRQGLVGVGPAGSLRLSYILGRTMLGGLREDGYKDLADVFEAFFDVRDDEATAERRALDRDLDALTAHDLRHVCALIASLANATRRDANAPRPLLESGVADRGISPEQGMLTESVVKSHRRKRSM